MQNNRHIPAEWEKHAYTLLSFPHEGRDWPGKYEPTKWAFVEIIRKVALFEPVLLMVKDAHHREQVADMLDRAHANMKQITFFELDTNRNWMRDSGPITVLNNGKREMLNFGFTGWAKYTNNLKDRKVPSTVAQTLNLPCTVVKHKGRTVVLEGGAIDHNGQGTLVTTRECLLHPTEQIRNAGFTQEDYEVIFAKYLGIEQVIWLGDGIDGDDTHGHVDDICRFVNEDTVVACVENDKSDPNHKKLAANLEILRGITLANGKKLNVVEMPMPTRLDFEDLRLPASYVNFIFVNGGVLVPTFNDVHDCEALNIYRNLFPNRQVIGINAIDLIWGLGTLHCLSHEIPAGK